jgi:hypothetical protein
MKDVCYIIADSVGVLRMTKRAPSLGREEIAVKVSISIPDSAFRSPIVSASLDVPEERVVHPDIEMDVEQPPQTEAQP